MLHFFFLVMCVFAQDQHQITQPNDDVEQAQFFQTGCPALAPVSQNWSKAKHEVGNANEGVDVNWSNVVEVLHFFNLSGNHN